MSLITRCPACETLFRVVPDQLRISEGWVRCGQCDEIFDASYHLLTESLTAVQPDSILNGAQGDFSVSEALQAEPLSPNVESMPLQYGDSVDLPEEWSQVAEHEIPVSEAFIAAPTALGDELPFALALPQVLQTEMPESEVFTGHHDDDDDDDDATRRAELAAVSFLRNQNSNFEKPNPRKRVVLFALSFFLLLCLLVQIMVHERDRILALTPSLQPLLQAMCMPFTCTLSPLRRLDSIVVESASFTKLNGTTYRLNFMVKNSATTALAVPAVELTLTDLFDQPVVRRVFLATEIGVKSPVIGAGAEWPASLEMEVQVEGAPDPVAGYRVLAFYP